MKAGIQATGQFDAIFYGLAHNIFRKHGIDLEVTLNISSSSSVPLLAANQIQLSGSAPTTMMSQYAAGVKTEAIMGYLQSDLTGISTNANLHITKPAQLVGHTIAVGAGTSTIGILAAYLAHYGLNETEVHVVQVPVTNLSPELAAGQVDGIAGFPTALDVQVNQLGVKTNVLSVLSAGSSFQEIQEVWAVGDVWAQAHPRALQQLTAALIESTEGALANPKEGAKDEVKFAPQTGQTYSIALGSFLAESKYFSTPADKGHRLGWMSPKDWAHTLAFGETFLGVKPMSVAPLFTNKYLPANAPLVS